MTNKPSIEFEPFTNNYIYTKEIDGILYLYKFPISKHSKENFENNVQAKKLLQIPIDLISNEHGKGLRRKFIQGITGKELLNQLLIDKKIILSLAVKIKRIHQIKGLVFAENLVSNGVNSLKEITMKRLDKLYKFHGQISLIDQTVLNDIYKEIMALLPHLNEVTPSFTHFDLHENNLVWDGQELHIIDFENARYYDHLWDIFMISKNLFTEKWQMKLFCTEYFNKRGLSKQEEFRIDIYRKLDTLRNIPYIE
jgi:thiamine kinase-like enzyme